VHQQAEAAALRLLIEGPPTFGDGDGTPVLRGAAWATLLDALAVAEFTRSFFTQLESAPLSAAEVTPRCQTLFRNITSGHMSGSARICLGVGRRLSGVLRWLGAACIMLQP